jgi:hypothetical protein
MDYYGNNPQLLPQLPFTWHHGWKRWRLFLFAIMVFIDGSIVPILLYYTMRYAGHVAGWIIFAVVTTIWGGPTYVEFAIRTLRLMKKERFYRPLGTDSRWCFDILNWTSVLTITAVTALFIVGSAPHEVWLRVLCMPAPAILYCIGGVLALITLFHLMNWPAPFRLSSTGKGEKVRTASIPCLDRVDTMLTLPLSLKRFSQGCTISSRTLSQSMPAQVARFEKLLRHVTTPVPASGRCCSFSHCFGPFPLLSWQPP